MMWISLHKSSLSILNIFEYLTLAQLLVLAVPVSSNQFAYMCPQPPAGQEPCPGGGLNPTGKCSPEIYEHIPDLSKSEVGFGDQAHYAFVHGVFIFYKHVNFNGGGPEGVAYFHGTKANCNPFKDGLAGQMSSVRYAGAMKSSDSAITFYMGNHFQHQDEVVVDDAKDRMNLAGRVQSIIVTGDKPWIVEDGSGLGVCLQPGQDASPNFIPDSKQLILELAAVSQLPSNFSIRSVRRAESCPSAGVAVVDLRK